MQGWSALAGGQARCRLSSDICPLTSAAAVRRHAGLGLGVDESKKGIWWMPWYREAMKDVARCEKLGGEASAR
jgi:hypothetical protein